MIDGAWAALSTLLVFWFIVGAGPFYDWTKRKIRSSVRADKRFSNNDYSNYNRHWRGSKDDLSN